ncbi:capsule assembly Wzi family protein [Larkinella humicola]|uniref:Capsule assembly Wzi family protein n=1 Tax=Larkinella humicola TaxID=2607654 RepID=A0A5N1JGY9_9BACT|nr:capsule assembly Wzi family protein [Larkinella humicola]KAA9354974.1 capsule assembly Wzi family protein [Larkinella humicola]
MKILYCLPVIYTLFSWSVFAQNSHPHQVSAYTEVGAFGSTAERTPFWLRANQYGSIPLSSPGGTLRVGIQGTLLLTDTTSVRSFIRPHREWTLSYAAESVGNAGKTNQLLLPEAYIKLTHKGVELVAGRRREVIGLVDSTLSSGSYSWSGNALPIPKIQIGTRGFISLNSWLALNAFFAHGWFGDTWYIKRSFLHQKSITWRIGKPSWRARFYAGLNHNVQWAGHTDRLPNNAISVNGQMPNRLSDFPNVVFAIRTNGLNNDRITKFDWENMYGNHVGSLDIAAELPLQTLSVLLYHQHSFEDASSFLLQNIPDGLYGIRLRTNRSSPSFFHLVGLNMEFFSTVFQSGDPALKNLQFGWGGDNNFNHAQYQEGWVYRNRVIGSPFLTRLVDAKPEYRIGYIVNNNRVKMAHLGIQATLANKIDVMARVSYSENKGTYNYPFPKTLPQWSSVLQLGLPVSWLGGCWLTAAVSVDSGELYENATGGFISLRKPIWQTSGTRIAKKPTGWL